METDGLTTANWLTLRLAFDSATLVLIWLVELVIYPVYTYLAGADFRRWHPLYTRRVTYVVLPLMVGQLALYAYCVFLNFSPVAILNLTFVLVIWAITFFAAVPLHTELDQAIDHRSTAARLGRVNRWRTALWTGVWLHTTAEFVYRIIYPG